MEEIEVLNKKKLLAPKLRFKEFSGEWETRKYKDLTTLVTNGFVGKAKDFYVESDGITYIQGYNVVEGGFNLRGIKQVSKDFHKKNKKSDLVEGDLLTIQTGDIGTTTIVTKELAGSNCHALVISRFKSELASPYFYMLLLNSQRGRNQLKTIETGSTMKHLNVGDIIDLIVQYPTLPEQQKIASFLSAVDEKIQQLTRKKELLEQYKKGVMQQLFSGKLRFKDEDGKTFPEWEEKRLGDIGDIVTGKTPSTTDLDLWNGEIQFVTPTDIYNNKYQFSTQRTIKELTSTRLLPAKSIMFTCIASIGKMSLSIRPCITNQQINSIIPYKEFDNEFVYYSVLNISEYIKSTQSTTTLPIINKTEFSKFKIKVPLVFEEQKKIANYLSSIDNKIEIVSKQITQTQAFKKGLLQQMFV